MRGMYVFVHPALTPAAASNLTPSTWVARRAGILPDPATIRLITSGVLDRYPKLTIQMSHFGGGIASMLGRIRGFQDREFFGTATRPVHGKPENDLDYYFRERLVFDTAGFCGASRRSRLRSPSCPPHVSSWGPTIRRRSGPEWTPRRLFLTSAI